MQLGSILLPSISFARLNKLSWCIIIRNVEPQTMRHRGWDTFTKTKRISTNKISTNRKRIVKSIKKIRC